MIPNEIIIHTIEKLKPHELIHDELYHPDKEYKKVKFLVLRESSKDEYLKLVNELNLSHMLNEAIHSPLLNFYLVRILD